MDEKKYVNAIVGKIKCSRKKKREIKKRLLADIRMRENQGERTEEIISRMGTAAEIADGFNENISDREQKQYVRNRIRKVVISVVVVLLFLVLFVYWVFPKTADMEQSKYFDMEQVETAMKETIGSLDAEDYAVLQGNAVPKMQSLLNEEMRADMRGTLSDDWGERKQFGAVYMVELIQGNRHFAVGEMTVTYENVSVTYRLTYDEEMRLAGIYVR